MHGQPDLNSNIFISLGHAGQALHIEDPLGGPSNLVIQANQAFNLYVDFDLAGIFAPWITTLSSVQYTVRYFYEGMAGNPDGLLGTVGPQSLIPGQLAYTKPQTNYNVPANFFGTKGLYKISAVVSFGGNPPLTAFDEGEMIEVF